MQRQPLLPTQTDPELGLTTAQVRERTEKGWTNGTICSASGTEWQIISKNLLTFFNLVFAVLALLLAFAGSSIKNMTFLVIVMCNIIIGCYQEIRAKRAVDKLTLVAAEKIHVLRDGVLTTISSEELVLDDIVEFVVGDQICADALILSGSVQVNEALVTGEEDAVARQPGETLLSGSFVVAGKCRARLTAVGNDSFAAKLALEAKKNPRVAKSEMMTALDKLIRLVGLVLIPVGLALFYQEFKLLSHSLTDSAEATVAALIGMIPEGLYLLTSVAMAASSLKLTRDKVLVKDLNCIESLAHVDVLCVDKTGTITEAAMEVSQVVPLTQVPDGFLEEIFTAFYAGADPENDTARALSDRFSGETDWECLHRIPFTSETKWSAASFHTHGTFVVGAPEFVMAHRYAELQPQVEKWSKNGSRVLLAAQFSGELTGVMEPDRLQPLALIVLSNRIRPAARDTFRYFNEQGVTIKVISGDNPLAASQVALRAQIPGAEQYIDASTLTTDEALADAATRYTVFGRVTPDQKKKLITALKAAGHTVAMTGDGVNDVLAMKTADCSIAMASGAQAASQVAQLVLLESDFAAMPAIVGEGRRVINNINRAASLFIVKNIISLGLSLISLLVGWPYPLEPIQLSIISVLTIGVPSFFLAMEPNYERVTGKFLPTVLRRSLPGGLTSLVTVTLAQVLMPVLGMPANMQSTLCTGLICMGGLVVLHHTCKPYNLMRRILWFAMLLAITACFTLLRGFFNLHYGSLTQNLTFLSILLAPPLIFTLISQVIEKLERLFRRKK